MKKLLIVLLALASVSVFAQESEFERGFNAGKETCKEAKEAWFCSVDCAYGAVYSTGQASTRAAAVLKINYTCLDAAVKNNIKPTCIEI